VKLVAIRTRIPKAVTVAELVKRALKVKYTITIDTKEFLDMQGKNVRVSEMAITLWKDEDDGMERGKG